MRKRRLKIEDLRICLSYDSEVKKFLSFKERCIIHKSQIQIIDCSYPLNLSPELKEKISETLREIRRKHWKKPEYHFESESATGIVKKTRIN